MCNIVVDRDEFSFVPYEGKHSCLRADFCAEVKQAVSKQGVWQGFQPWVVLSQAKSLSLPFSVCPLVGKRPALHDAHTAPPRAGTDWSAGNADFSPPIVVASVMRVTAIHAETERKREARSVRRAKKRRRRARTQPLYGLIHAVLRSLHARRRRLGRKSLSSRQIQANLRSPCMPLGEYRLKFTRIACIVPT